MTVKGNKKKRRRKAVKKKTKLISDITPKDLIPAHYNPREMDDEAKSALKKSMEEFNDISGITWNKQTGNIVTGHHRWEEICELHGMENLTFSQISPDRLQVLDENDEDTGFILRVVDWSEAREKAANVTANSHKIAGVFTDGLKDILTDIQFELPDTFTDLRLDDLAIDFGPPISGTNDSEDEGSWESNIEGVDKIDSNLDGIITTIKIDCPQEMRSDIFGVLQEVIEENGWSDKVSVK